MSSVPHAVPSRLAHTIATLYGHDDDTLLAWQRFCVQASEALRTQHDSQRLTKALALAQDGAVELEYKGGSQLRHAREEVEYIESLRSRGIVPRKLPAEPLPIFQAVDNGGFGVLHYVGHASQTAGNIRHSQLELEPEELVVGGTQKTYPHSLEPTHVANKGATWGTYRPLVFFNACQTGLADVQLIRTGGWATALLGSKAGAFVGTLWSVRDSAALLFAKTFYNALLHGETFGESALAARRQVAATRDPSWLAYVIYAHPNARAVVQPPF